MSRKPAEHEGITHLSGDVTKPETIEAAVNAVLEREDHIDILVNNAGFGISGAIEFTEPEEARKQMEVNFFGMVNVCHAVLPHMREAGHGRIVNLSSVAAPIAIPFQAFYSASKAAINAYSQALANEVRPYGVTVCAVMPGDIRTGFTAARKKVQLPTGVAGVSPAVMEVRYPCCTTTKMFPSYKEESEIAYPHAEHAVAAMERDEQHGLTPQAMARSLYHIATARYPRPQYIGGAEYRLFAFLHWLLPQRLVNYIVGRIYA